MSELRVLLIDDEPLALRRIEILIRNIPGIICCGSAGGVRAGLDATRELHPDVVLLDIRMRDGTGFDYLSQLPKNFAPAVIFVTAFDSHAIDAFSHNAIDYILKPIELSRLVAALERARQNVEHRSLALRIEEMQEVISSLRNCDRTEARPKYETEIWVRKRVTGFVRVLVKEIDWISADDDYVRLHLSDRDYLLRSTLSEMERRLDPHHFLRIHRSTIVRRAAVAEYRKDAFGLQACLFSGQLLRVGRVYARALRSELSLSERYKDFNTSSG